MKYVILCIKNGYKKNILLTFIDYYYKVLINNYRMNFVHLFNFK